MIQKLNVKQLFIVLTSCGLSACAGVSETATDGESADSSRRTDCIFRSSVRGYTVLDESNLIVESGRRNYHLILRRRAHGLKSSWGIGFDSPTGRICANSSDVVFKGSFDAEKIGIQSLRELSPEEHEDLLIRFGKKEPEIKQTPAPKEVGGADVEELDPAVTDESSSN